jgi:arylsulfate sulfotransferase
VEITVLGNIPVSHESESLQQEHEIPVLGLYPGTTNRILVKITDEDLRVASDTITIETEALPSFFPDVEIVVAQTEMMEPGWSLCCHAVGTGTKFASYPLMFDEEGTIRWYLNMPLRDDDLMAPMEQLENGNLLFGDGTNAYEYDLMGNEIHRWKIPGNYDIHHDVIKKPNGNLLVAVVDYNLETVEDILLELDGSSGSIVNTWDMREVLDVYRRDLVNDSIDWFHMNAIWYSEDDNCLVVSGRQQCVVKVTDDNEPVWILAPHKGWGKAGVDSSGHETSEYLLTAIDANNNAYGDSVQLGTKASDNFSWPWGQHAPMYLPGGNLFLYDNGFNRNFAPGVSYSMGIEYEIDETNMTVKQVWQYGRERGPEFQSMIVSDVDLLEQTGNRLITSGITFSDPSYTTIVEVSYPGKDLIFEAKLYYKNALVPPGSSGWGSLDLTYRSDRASLY